MRTEKRRSFANDTSPPSPLSKREGELVFSSKLELEASSPSLLERGLGGEVPPRSHAHTAAYSAGSNNSHTPTITGRGARAAPAGRAAAADPARWAAQY
ncbi:hypothetical protein E4631_19035 [Hymenobacter sp. UV11]|nr:hypothetical protein E4631_19035 [Hymenobacter sp. UV11]